MVGEAGIVLPGEAMEMGSNHRGSALGGIGTEVISQDWQAGGGLEELASLHGGFLPE
jgi:hypothetical protein